MDSVGTQEVNYMAQCRSISKEALSDESNLLYTQLSHHACFSEWFCTDPCCT